jgi:hypothetical protein
MKHHLALIGMLLAGATPAIADPGVFLGVTYNFGGSVGVSLKLLSTNKEDRGALAAGVSYYPTTSKFGIDAGAGYLFKNGAVTLGWDFLNSNPQVGIGYVNTKDNNPASPPPPPPPPPPEDGE